MPAATSAQPKLVDDVRQALRLLHYSIHTERSYAEWIVRFVRFHGMRSRADLFPVEPKIESFLTDPAGQWKRRCRHPEPSHECLGVPLPPFSLQLGELN